MPLVLFRRELLAIAAGLPVLGCSLDTEGIPGNDINTDTNTDTPTPLEPPFDHKVVLNLVSVRNLERPFTLQITFTADVTGVGPREHSPPALKNPPSDPNQTLVLPIAVEDDSVIALAEEGTVTCKCKFVYDTGDEEDVPPVNTTVSHDKLPGQPLPEFSLSYVNQDYALT